MKITRIFVACLAVLAFLGLAMRSAYASEYDCSTSGTPACNFTGTQTTLSTQTHTSPFGASLSESYYQNGSVYTYVFTIKDTGTHTIQNASLSTSLAGYTADSFNASGPFGIVKNMTNITISANAGCGTGAFCFGSSAFFVDFGNAFTSGKEFTFYVTGPAPVAGELDAVDTGTDIFSAPVAGAEPKSILLLGVTFLTLTLGIPLARRFGMETA